jgi:hypothetical protein
MARRNYCVRFPRLARFGSSFGRADPDPLPVPHQAATVGLQRSGDRDPQQWELSLPGRSAPTFPQTPIAPGVNRNHNHDLKWTFKSASVRASSSAGLLQGFYERFAHQGNEAFNGPSHLGAQDGGDHLNHLEERSVFRGRTSEIASSLSISGRLSVSSWDYSGR